VRILFLTGGSPATVFGLVPLATAARNAGHEVFMGSTAEMMPFVAGAGLPAVALTTLTRRDFVSSDQAPQMPADPTAQMRLVGSWYGRLAEACLDTLDGLGRDWRPDLVVGGTLAYAAPVFAAKAGIPYVRHMWDTMEPTGYDDGAAAHLRPVLAAIGHDDLPTPDLWIDICPPSLRPPTAPPAELMRWIPGNQQRPLEPWMYTRGERRRVCVTAGSRVTNDERLAFLGVTGERLSRLMKSVAALDVEIVIAAPEEVAAHLRAELGVRAGWIPLDVLAPTCSVIVHHDGGLTALTAMIAGVPQLCIPKLASSVAPAQRLAASGAAITLLDGQDSPEQIAAACERLLSDPSYAARARALSEEIAGLRSPADMVGSLEQLAGAGVTA